MNANDMAAIQRRAMPQSSTWSAQAIGGLANGPGGFVATSLHGFALGRVVADEAELLMLAVDPAHQRSGQGQRLLGDFEAAAASRGARRAFLEVASANGAARRLYQRAGWRDVGRREGYYRLADGTKSDAILLEKPLEQSLG